MWGVSAPAVSVFEGVCRMPKHYGRGGKIPLEPKIVRRIRRARRIGTPLRVLADRYDCSIATAHRAASGVGWYARPEYNFK